MTTHLSYEGAEVYADGQVVMTNPLYRSGLNQSTLRGPLAELVLFKIKLYSVKVLLSIGDGNIGREDGCNFSTLLRNEHARATFALSVTNHVRQYSFDGKR